ncbi:TetR/AcrR family transcriptional regulator [Propionivibrio soli]|uniref:TetR/AcrR family transcriptional regulator n=1 Tax=Propionivibrio soli TaxID=2976531 RepID=UPI0021E768A2|nr:TetR/AcrR family transcriptional regulator [Propionivibrio soli]
MKNTSDEPSGLRERKRRETLGRIAEAGLQLFVKKGYEETTLENIAAAAGVSRRTLFYYFKSKEDILLAWQGSGFAQALHPTMLQESPDQFPLDAARECLLKLASRLETKESIAVDGLLRSSEALRARKEAAYVELEHSLLNAMLELWPDPTKRNAHRVTAMVAIGTLRLALESWREEGGQPSLAHHISRHFDLLKHQV